MAQERNRWEATVEALCTDWCEADYRWTRVMD